MKEIMRNFFRQYYFLLFLLPLMGCLTARKNHYLQPAEQSSGTLRTFERAEVAAYRLQTHDLLSIRINVLDEEMAGYFNNQPKGMMRNMASPADLYINGYSIDREGFVELPAIGRIRLVGFTLEQAQDSVQALVAQFLNSATATVKLGNFKVSVVGEVNVPGYYFIYNEQLNLLELLAQAGDLTDFGNRKHVSLIRQTEVGSEVISLNLTDPAFLSSPYYIIQPNDIVYVPAQRVKFTKENLTYLNLLGILFGGLGALAFFLSTQRDNN